MSAAAKRATSFPRVADRPVPLRFTTQFFLGKANLFDMLSGKEAKSEE